MLSHSLTHSDSQKITLLLRSPKVYYRVHKSPPLVHILSHMNPVQTFSSYVPKIHINIILSFTPRSSE